MSRLIRSYRDLDVWRKGVDLAVDLYGLTRRFPASERFGISSQLQRSGVSISTNLAEGHGKDGPGLYLSHISHARGSLREVETLLIIADRIGYVPRPVTRGFLRRTDEIGRMLFGLSSAVAASEAGGRAGR